MKVNPKISIIWILMVFQNNTQIAGKVSWQFFKQMDIYYLRFSNILFKAVQKCSIFKIHMLRKSSMQKKLAKVHRLNSILQTKLLMVNYHADKFLEAYLESCQTSTKEILRKWLTKKAVNYMAKKVHRGCLIGIWLRRCECYVLLVSLTLTY